MASALLVGHPWVVPQVQLADVALLSPVLAVKVRTLMMLLQLPLCLHAVPLVPSCRFFQRYKRAVVLMSAPLLLQSVMDGVQACFGLLSFSLAVFTSPTRTPPVVTLTGVMDPARFKTCECHAILQEAI